MKVPALELAARIAEAKGDRAAAIDLWRKTVEAQDAAGYDEPPAWYYPVRESLGGALLRAGKNDEAEAVFRDALQRNPRSPRALFGLLETLRRQNKAGIGVGAASVRCGLEWRGGGAAGGGVVARAYSPKSLPPLMAVMGALLLLSGGPYTGGERSLQILACRPLWLGSS